MRRRMMFVTVAFFLSASLALSKASLSKLVISGGKLPQPIEVTDPEVLKASNPWFGTFIPQWNQASDQKIAEPPETVPHHQILFYASSSPNEPPHIIYVVYYVFDPTTRRGLIYLPGEREQWYWTNVRSIIRPAQDGRWNIASANWSDQINSIVTSGGTLRAASVVCAFIRTSWEKLSTTDSSYLRDRRVVSWL